MWGTDAGADRVPSSRRASTANKWKPTCTLIARARTTSSRIIPPWVHEGGKDAMLARLKDPDLRPRFREEVLNGIPGSNWYNHYTATGSWEGMLLVSLSNPQYKKFEGKRMNEVIARWVATRLTFYSS